MNSFKPGDVVTVEGTVVRTRDGRVEMQAGDGQLLRIPCALVRAAAPAEGKAVERAPENKAVANAPENKSARHKQNVDNTGGTRNAGGGKPGA